ncbi:MAG TPA: sigma 54-interacting transcriptional regulator [Polyangia bacterium]|nr:sigma 54-interacting transcriptional regulator [Polyangia bacterium]
MIRLKLESGGAALGFGAEPVAIGRAETNQVVVANRRVSAVHALIVPSGAGYSVRDRASTNGTAVARAGHHIPVPKDGEVALQNGDRLLLGGEEGAELAVEIDALPAGAGRIESTVVAAEEPGGRGAAAARAARDEAAARALLGLADEMAAAQTSEEALAALEAWAQRVLSGCGAVGVMWRDAEAGDWQAVRGAPSRTLAERVTAEKRALLLLGAELAAVVSAAQKPQVIVAPLGALGALQIDARSGSGFSAHDLDLVAVGARYAALALERLDLEARLRAAEQQLRRENRLLRERQARGEALGGRAPAFVRVLGELDRVAPAATTVLLEGETGVGKEVLARRAHERSPRRDKLFVPVNCGAMTETLLESELFGHKKGAFTGAASDKRGVFEVAHGGTVFLDEVGETPAALQVRLLRVLQEGTIRPVGEVIERKVDVRIIAATNRDLKQLVQEGRFRQDLYYRLAVFPLRIPPLRERREDIPELAGAFVARFARELGKPVPRVPEDVMGLLLAYAWPGNVRELQNEIERALVRMEAGADALAAELFSEEVQAAGGPAAAGAGAGPSDLRAKMAGYERQVLKETLAAHAGRRAAAAAALGLTRQGLAKKLERFGLAPPARGTHDEE